MAEIFSTKIRNYQRSRMLHSIKHQILITNDKFKIMSTGRTLTKKLVTIETKFTIWKYFLYWIYTKSCDQRAIKVLKVPRLTYFPNFRKSMNFDFLCRLHIHQVLQKLNSFENRFSVLEQSAKSWHPGQSKALRPARYA